VADVRQPVPGAEWLALSAELQAVTPVLACLNCGATMPSAASPPETPVDVTPSGHCGDCPPWRCEDCGETCSAAAPCSCWIKLGGMPLADIKALFANDDVLAIGGLGRHEPGETLNPPLS
jgi:hypothetical protein